MPASLLTPPAREPVSLAEAKHFLRIDHDDEDALIESLIASARLHAEAQTRRAFITQAWRITRDVWPSGGVLPILPAPLRQITAIGVWQSDGTLQAVDLNVVSIDRHAAPAVLAFNAGAMPQPGRAAAGIEIDIQVGYGDAESDMPAPLRQAIKLLAAHWYEHRGVITASGEVATVPSSVAALLAPFRVLSL